MSAPANFMGRPRFLTALQRPALATRVGDEEIAIERPSRADFGHYLSLRASSVFCFVRYLLIFASQREPAALALRRSRTWTFRL